MLCTMITFENLLRDFPLLRKELSELTKLVINLNSQTLPTPEALLTIQQASEFLNLSVPTIYSKVSKGELPVMKQGKRLYFSSIELMQFIKDGKKKTYAEIEAEAVNYLKK
jgi:excisionase family DNA binding protein